MTFTPRAGFTTWSKALAVDPSDENVLWTAGIGGAFDKSIDGGRLATAARWTKGAKVNLVPYFLVGMRSSTSHISILALVVESDTGHLQAAMQAAVRGQ